MSGPEGTAGTGVRPLLAGHGKNAGQSDGGEEVAAGLVDGGQHGAAQDRGAGDGGGDDAGAGRADAGDLGGHPVGHGGGAAGAGRADGGALGAHPVGQGGAAGQADVAAQDDQAGIEDHADRGDTEGDAAGGLAPGFLG